MCSLSHRLDVCVPRSKPWVKQISQLPGPGETACSRGRLLRAPQRSGNVNLPINSRLLLVGLPFLFLSQAEAGFSLKRENYCFSAVSANHVQHSTSNRGLRETLGRGHRSGLVLGEGAGSFAPFAGCGGCPSTQLVGCGRGWEGMFVAFGAWNQTPF